MAELLRGAYAIIGIGFTGFAFMLAFLSYRLVGDIARKPKADERVLRAIRRYSWFTFALAGLALATRAVDLFADSYFSRTSEEAITCRDGLERLTNASAVVAKDYDSLLRSVERDTAGCRTILKHMARK